MTNLRHQIRLIKVIMLVKSVWTFKMFLTVDDHIEKKSSTMKFQNFKMNLRWANCTTDVVSINGFNSNLAEVKCGVLQSSMQEPLFFTHINGLYVLLF